MTNLPPERWFPHIRSEICIYSTHTRTVPGGWTCGRHVHHMLFEINLVLDGTQTAIAGSTEHEQHAGDLMLISPMQMHDYQIRGSENTTFFVVHFQVDDPVFHKLFEMNNKGLYAKGHPLNTLLVPLVMNLMKALFEDSKSTSRLFLHLFTLITELQSYFNQEGQGKELALHSELSYLIAKEIETRVLSSTSSDQPGGDWLESISHNLGVSRRHCHRIFKQFYGMSPREYLMILKRQEAMQMLVSSTETIERIAHRIGYENVQSFSRQFVSWIGCTPGAFRKNHQDDVLHLTPLER
ncbi:AraC family transcriptional regulator [Paenibacillus sp. J22TS3]|uniref:helix-turn-helix domain-containing protein n=1 Tax=Paenibacillus sp. J22TS3 TaxID=2807192 RepID=UPI001B177C97|nr:AraC family transcriptional regulator [Paenibacillus sp. J22TS3]GIP21323.1 transcriptional regulator [Paenibacillus sp. J22TS3]